MNSWFLRKSWQAIRLAWYRRNPVFTGSYPSFAGIPYDGWFAGDEWRNKAIGQVNTARKDDPAFIPDSLSLSKAMLATVVGPMLSDDKPVRILDFGGASGADYANLRNCIGDAKIEYTVVDEETLIAAGRELFAGDSSIKFLTKLPSGQQFDVIYSCSSLQYVEDYKTLFTTFASYQPKAMLFVRHCVSRKTFARQQRNRGSMPEWAYGLDDLQNLMSGLGYQLVMKAYSEDDFNADNYPREQRIERSANLLFTRKG